MSARPLEKITDFSISKNDSKHVSENFHKDAVKSVAPEKAHHAKTGHTKVEQHNKVEQHKFLPAIEIVDTKALKGKLLDQKSKPEEKLEAAHKLYKADHKQFAEKHEGKTRYYQIVEKPVEKNNEKLTRVAVVEVENKTARLYLDGTMDKHGKFEAAPVENIDQKKLEQKKAEQKQAAHKPAAENHHKPEQSNSDRRSNEQPERSRNRSYNNSYSGGDHSSSDYGPDENARSYSAGRDSNFNAGRNFTKVSKAEAEQLFKGAENAPVDKLTKLPNGCVYLRSKLAVDADGGKDWRSDPYGQPTTSLTNSDGSALDATEVFYFVLPMTDEYENLGIKLGDLAWVRNAKTGKMVPAIFGDRGPKGKIGEGSQALCRALGLSGDPRNGGTSQKDIEFLIIPGSGTGKGDISKNAVAMADRLQSTTVASSAGNSDSSVAGKIVACARAEEGEKLWTEFSSATRNGRLGCAISTSTVLRAAGLDIPKITGAAALVDKLEDKGWKKVDVSQAKPGDVIYGEKPGKNARAGGGNAHVGIVEGYDRDSKKLMVYANVSRTGKWTNSTSSRAFSPRSFGDNVWAFTPPSA